MQAVGLVAALLFFIQRISTTPLVGTDNSLVRAKACPDTWFVRNTSNGECQCGSRFHGIVTCDHATKEVRVLDCYCITFDSFRNTTVLGECPYNCVNGSNSHHGIYHPVPRDLVRDDDNNSVCGYLHRTGTLCGQCMKNYYQTAFSYNFDCIQCERSEWLQYIASAYIPLTVFMIFILIFRVSIVSPKLYGMISMLQNLASPLNIRIVHANVKQYHNGSKVAKILITLLGIWNLDFFRNLIPSICLQITALENLALDYLIAVYPMVVTAIAFSILQMHYYGFGPVVVICRPFQRLFANFRKSWNLQTTLIDAFITFFILSTTKTLYVSVDILLTAQLYDAEGKSLGQYWYENATIRAFNSEHKPYAVLAISAITFLIVLPIALLVGYQFSFCQVCLTKTRLKGQVLEDFMHSFNRYYKDGSGGTRDCRWFAAFPIMTRLGLYFLILLPLAGILYNLTQLYYIVCSIAVLILEPYKYEYSFHNSLEPCIYLFLSLVNAGVTGLSYSYSESSSYNEVLFVFITLNAMVPFIYLSVVAVWWIYKKTHFFKLVQQSLTVSDLPDRLLHSENY